MPLEIDLRGEKYKMPTRGDDPPWSQDLNNWRTNISLLLNSILTRSIIVSDFSRFKTLESAIDHCRSNSNSRRIIVSQDQIGIKESIKVDIPDLEIKLLPGIRLLANEEFLIGIGDTEEEKHISGSILNVTVPGVTISGGRIGFPSNPSNRTIYQHAIYSSKSGGLDLLISSTRWVGFKDFEGSLYDTEGNITTSGTFYEKSRRENETI